MSHTSCYDPNGDEAHQARSNLSDEALTNNDISVTISENFDELNLAASVCLLHGCMIEKNNYTSKTYIFAGTNFRGSKISRISRMNH